MKNKMFLKGKMFAIITFLCLVMSMVSVYGETISNYSVETVDNATNDYKSIKSLEADIIQGIKELNEFNDVKNEQEQYTIDYGNAVKIYVDTDIFAIRSEKMDDIIDKVKKGKYIWLLQVSGENNKYEVQIAKGLPLTEEAKSVLTKEEINAIKENTGKWTISLIKEIDINKESYIENIHKQLKDCNIDAAKVVICGGLKHINDPAAIIGDKEAEAILPLEELKITGTKEQVSEAKVCEEDSNKVYKYNIIKDASNEMEDSLTNDTGNSNAKIIFSSKQDNFLTKFHFCIILISIGMIMVLVYKKKRLKKTCVLLLLICLTITFTACGVNRSDDKKESIPLKSTKRDVENKGLYDYIKKIANSSEIKKMNIQVSPQNMSHTLSEEEISNILRYFKRITIEEQTEKEDLVGQVIFIEILASNGKTVKVSLLDPYVVINNKWFTATKSQKAFDEIDNYVNSLIDKNN